MLDMWERKARERSLPHTHTHTHTTHIQTHRSRAQLKTLQAKKDGLLGSLRLKSNMLTSNMHCLDSKTRAVQSYDSTVSLMDEFMPLRSELYVKRRDYEIENLEIRVNDLEERANFVDCVTSGKVVLSNRPRDTIVSELRERGFSEYPRSRSEDEEKKRPYDHLLNMSLSELSRERIERLRSQSDRASLDLSTLQDTSPEDIWLSDLEKLRDWFKEEGGYEKRKSRPKY
jgi:DNA topoisomerase II